LIFEELMALNIELSIALCKVESRSSEMLIYGVDKTGNDGGQKGKNYRWRVDKGVDKEFFLPCCKGVFLVIYFSQFFCGQESKKLINVSWDKTVFKP
jgi:hypothetical protein